MPAHGHAQRLVHRRGNPAFVADREFTTQAENAWKRTPDSSENGVRVDEDRRQLDFIRWLEYRSPSPPGGAEP